MQSSADSDRWFYKTGGTKAGPVSGKDLQLLIVGRRVPFDVKVWCHGMNAWLPAGESPDLFPTGIPPTVRYGVTDTETEDNRTHSPSRRIILATTALCASLLCLGLRWMIAARGSDPYRYRSISGHIGYEDGQPIPADAIYLTFIPLGPPLRPGVHPRCGFASVNPRDGFFASATSRKRGDGIVDGKHRVLVRALKEGVLRTDLVPKEYLDFERTPLEVDAGSGRVELTVRRPEPGK
ncbi:MAG: DUF4339 domain-containing protein [Betaproteobacteria bacterium]|nr:DUF4339 domain-containing protein [Betaproteobacteria bacterium]